MRLLLVEDNVPLADELTAGLQRQGYAVDWLADGRDAVYQGASEPYDAIILDLGLPGLPGLEVLAQWRSGGLATPVLILTARDSWAERIEGLKAGADDYLTKPFTTEELLARVRALLRRQGNVQMEDLAFGDIQLSLNSCVLSKDMKQVRLSHREFEVMRLLMSHPGSILSKEELILKIWGADSEAVDNNAEAYISFLRKKLFYLGSKVQITSQRRLGYLLEEGLC